MPPDFCVHVSGCPGSPPVVVATNLCNRTNLQFSEQPVLLGRGLPLGGFPGRLLRSVRRRVVHAGLRAGTGLVLLGGPLGRFVLAARDLDLRSRLRVRLRVLRGGSGEVDGSMRLPARKRSTIAAISWRSILPPATTGSFAATG